MEYSNWLFGSTTKRAEPTQQDVDTLVKLKSLWKDPEKMQTFCLNELEILMDTAQWSSWISKTISGQRAAAGLWTEQT